MPPPAPIIQLVEGVDTTSLAERLKATPSAATTVVREWYDTFDWRLWNANLVLEVDEFARAGGRRTAVLRSATDHVAAWTQRVDHVPPGVDDLPPGPWRRTLAPVLDLRALLPRVRVRLRSTRLTIIDAAGKSVVTLLVEEPVESATVDPIAPTVDGVEAEPTPLPERWVRVVAMRGYERDAAALTRKLERIRGVRRAPTHPLALLMGPSVTLGADPVALDLDVDPSMPAAEAMLAMLGHLHDTMQMVERRSGHPADTEFLHDYRVALRRSRSVLKMAKGVLSAGVLDEWRPALRDLQQRTGDVRDLDVFLLELDRYRSDLPPEFAGELGPLRSLLQQKRATATDIMREYLGSKAHGRDTARYLEFLRSEATDIAGESGDTPIADVAADILRRAHTRLIKRGRAVDDDSPSEEVHEVRIAGKELRYALELFAGLFRSPSHKALVKRLKQLQDLLGGFQDSEVHANAMSEFAVELAAAGDVPARCIMALGLLAQSFEDRKATIRDQFAETFSEFDSKETRELLDDVVGSS